MIEERSGLRSVLLRTEVDPKEDFWIAPEMVGLERVVGE
jgi:hypothetical protein